MEFIANFSFWQLALCIFGSLCFICLTARLLTLTIVGAYYEKKKQFIADITNAGAKALTKYKEEVKKNDQA